LKFLLSCVILTVSIFLSTGTVSAQDLERKTDPISVSGSLGGGLSYYHINGIPERRQPYGYSIFGSVNIQLYGWSLPFSIAVNQQGTSFSQPFTRFGVSPEYKWIKLHAGYRNLRFSEFTLNNITFYGGGVELTPGKFRFAAMYGRIREAVEEPDNPFQRRQYKRSGYGFKAGYGEKTFVDLSFFKAEDDLNSLNFVDSLESENPPEANTALGLSGRFNIIDKRLSLDYDLGLSAYTRNLRSPELDDVEVGRGAIDFFRINQSSNAAYAGNTSLSYRAKTFNAKLNYRYVQSGYRTLGANYLLSDVEMITASFGTSLFKKRMMLNASYGIQNNNTSEKRFANTSRNIGSFNISYRTKKNLTFNLSYSNFSIYQTLLQDSLFADSVVVDQTNHQLNFSSSYAIIKTKYTHTFGINTSYQNLSDNRDDDTQVSIENQILSVNLTYGIRFNKKNYGFTTGINYQDLDAALTAQERYGVSIGFNASLWDKKVRLRAKQVWNRSVLPTRNDDIFTTQAFADYQFHKKHSVNLNGSIINRTGLNNFTELRIGIGYRMKF